MKILLTGASGQLGAYLIRRLLADGHEVTAWSGRRPESREGVACRPVDLTDLDRIASELDRADPDGVIHAAAISAADAVRLDPRGAHALNVEATRRIAGWAGDRDRRLVFTSTDLVFDGSRAWNREDDDPSPGPGLRADQA